MALAVALRRAGMHSVVWERAPVLREIGAGLLLTPNALWILDRLGLLGRALTAGRPVKTWRILDRRGAVLQTFARRGEPFSLSIARSAIQELLCAEVTPETLRLDHEVAGIEPSADGKMVALRSAHGDRSEAQIVIAADGVHSFARTAWFGAEAPRDCSYVGWRALVDHVPAAWAGGLITESWADGCRFGIAPISVGRSYWYATENARPGWTVAPGQRKAHLLAKFDRWHDPICALIDATAEEAILFSPIADHPRLRSWQRKGVALLGDAAHAMTPNLGQGAAMALEDAWVLAECLTSDGCGEKALAQYERHRRGRTSWVSWQSRQVGRMIQLEHPWLCCARDNALRWMPDALGALALSPVFNFRA